MASGESVVIAVSGGAAGCSEIASISTGYWGTISSGMLCWAASGALKTNANNQGTLFFKAVIGHRNFYSRGGRWDIPGHQEDHAATNNDEDEQGEYFGKSRHDAIGSNLRLSVVGRVPYA
ncbi:MAG: hypothetical protein IIB67_07340 [Proteobacteria bacterium]|nr:hypothetical protein [Pseudomonadota bacterium]